MLFIFTLSFFGIMSVLSARLALTLFALNLGAPPATVGIITSLYAVFPLALSLVVGHIADRHGSRWLLLTAAVFATLAMLVPVFWQEIAALYVAGTLIGLAFAFHAVVIQNLVGVLSKPEERTRNFSNFSLVTATCLLMAPVLTGALIEHAGYIATFLYAVGLSLASALLLVVWGGRLPGGRAVAAQEAPSGTNLSDRRLWRVLAVGICVQIGTDLFQFCMPIYGHSIDLSSSRIGIVLGAFAAAAFVARIGMPHLIGRWGEQRLLQWCFWLGAASFLLIPTSQNVAVLVAISFAFGLGMGCSTPLSLMLMFSHSTQGRSGRALGLRLTTNNVTRVVGPSVFGSIGSAFGLWPIFVISALVMGLGGWMSRRGVQVHGK
jgi:MFS family permease